MSTVTNNKPYAQLLTAAVGFCLLLYQLNTGFNVAWISLPAPIEYLLHAVLAALLVIWITRNRAFVDDTCFFFLTLLALSLLVHFRSSVFFFGDAWDLLSRFSELGFRGVIHTHNEHFKPLFFATFYLECLLFKDQYSFYIFVSVLIHALNAYFVAGLLRRVLREMPHAAVVSNTLAILYALSALHAEDLHWAFEQSVMLSQLMITLGLISSWDYLSTKKRSCLARAMLFTFLSPLFFGNALTVIVQIGLLGVFFLVHQRVAQGEKKISWHSFLRLMLACGFSLGVVLLLYYLNRNVAENLAVSPSKMFANPKETLKYLLFGSQFGTVLRGLSLYPGLTVGAVRELLDVDTVLHIVSLKSFLLNDLDGRVITAGWFTSVLLLLIIPLFGPAQKSLTLSRWVFGQLFISSFFLLPALGRWQLGIMQSLSLRYQCGPLIGLAIISAPLVALLYCQKTERRLGSALVAIGMIYMLFVQLSVGSRYDYFTASGGETRTYVEALAYGEPTIPASFPTHATNESNRKAVEFFSR